VLRWAAKRPQYRHGNFAESTQRLFLGPLRSPTQDKPARHNSPPATDFVLTGCVDTYAAMRPLQALKLTRHRRSYSCPAPGSRSACTYR
ncbi:hypothetical protein FEM54_20010, partial [Pseudomonas edaphica]